MLTHLNKIKLVLLVIAVITMLFSGFELALAQDNTGPHLFDDIDSANPKLCDVIVIIGNARNIAILYLGPVAVVMIAISGIMLMVSGGNQELRKKAKQALTYSIIGLVIILVAWTIITAIFLATGFSSGYHFWEVKC